MTSTPDTAWPRPQEEKQKVIRDMQRFNMDARKYRGVISPITAPSLRQSALPKPEKPFLAFGRMMEASMCALLFLFAPSTLLRMLS